jgi:hypothetical protein
MLRSILLPVLVLVALPGGASAWHRAGHFATARIAWKQLDDGQRLAVYKLLKAHPHYAIYLAAERPKEQISEMEWAFLRATTWADWVRSPMATDLDANKRDAIRNEFNKPVWHYVDLPYIHPKDIAKFDQEAIRKEILVPAYDAKGEPRHVLAALEWAAKRLRARDIADTDRAVALTWLCHLVGDLHQPLHGTALIASKATLDPPLDPPGGDLGGNRILIKPRADSAKPVNLHFYWDAVLFADEPGVPGIDGVVAKLLNDPALQRDRLPELKATDFLAWAEESLALAKSTVYQGKDGFIQVRTLPPRGKRVDWSKLDVPVLPEGYIQAAERAACRRMVLAGYRLADQLRTALMR